MSKSITTSQRYTTPKVVEYLASQYVLGTLTSRVHKRVTTFLETHSALEQPINDWQIKLSSLDATTQELVPKDETWHNIAEQLAISTNTFTTDHEPSVNKKPHSSVNDLTWWQRVCNKINCWLQMPSYQYASAFSLVFLVTIVSLMSMNKTELDPLSYVAVLTDTNEKAHIVASTYGESQKLIVNIINTPKLSSDKSLELWVVSKTDHQARSLGVLPKDQRLLEQQLTNAQWRLIKDSLSLIVTIEDDGGSAIGEPSEIIVSRGLCVRLKEWNSNA